MTCAVTAFIRTEESVIATSVAAFTMEFSSSNDVLPPPVFVAVMACPEVTVVSMVQSLMINWQLIAVVFDTDTVPKMDRPYNPTARGPEPPVRGARVILPVTTTSDIPP